MSNSANGDTGPASRGCLAGFFSIMLTPLAIWGVIASGLTPSAVELKLFPVIFFVGCGFLVCRFMFTQAAMADINAKQNAKEIEKSKFYYPCEVLDGKLVIGTVELRDLKIFLKYKGGNSQNYLLEDILDVKMIQSDDANYKQGFGAAVLEAR